MPSKGRRAASRQAHLRQRKRRSKAQPQVFDPGPTESRRPVDDEADIEAGLEPAPLAVAAVPATPRAVRRGRQRTPQPEDAPVYRYLGPELRRIGAIASIIAIILAVLTVLLR